jgi:hypothetical protein
MEEIDLFVKIVSQWRRKEGRRKEEEISILRSASASSSHLKMGPNRSQLFFKPLRTVMWDLPVNQYSQSIQILKDGGWISCTN